MRDTPPGAAREGRTRPPDGSMSAEGDDARPYPSAEDDAAAAERIEPTPQTLSPSYRLAFADNDFLLQEELRPVRLQLELMKPEILLKEHGVISTVVVFGSARIPAPEVARARLDAAEAFAGERPEDPARQRQLAMARRVLENSRYYTEARAFACLVSARGRTPEGDRYVIVTGGGGGIMEAANRGAQEAGASSVGLNIVLPEEQRPNRYITPALCFQFHYFALRKMHFLLRARALAIFPGGFGTLDELFDALTLIQCGKMEPIPIVMFGRDYWRRVLDLDFLVEQGTIGDVDPELIQYAETAQEAWKIIETFERRRHDITRDLPD